VYITVVSRLCTRLKSWKRHETKPNPQSSEYFIFPCATRVFAFQTLPTCHGFGFVFRFEPTVLGTLVFSWQSRALILLPTVLHSKKICDCLSLHVLGSLIPHGVESATNFPYREPTSNFCNLQYVSALSLPPSALRRALAVDLVMALLFHLARCQTYHLQVLYLVGSPGSNVVRRDMRGAIRP
jgi:hypothetical protein